MGGRGQTVADEENPFDMDMSELQKAVAVAPKPTKQRTVEVKCSMCDTVGYVAPQHQGKLAKCANESCKHPYFTIPLPKKDNNEGAIKRKKGLSIPQLVGAVVGCLALAGFLIWWFIVRIPEPTVDPLKGGGGPLTGPGSGGVKPIDEPVKPKEPVAPPRTSLAEIQKSVMTDLVRVASQNDPNQARAFRYLAESYAVTGQAPLALAELQKLQAKTPDAAYLQIEPLIRLYRAAKKAGSPDAPRYVDLAVKAAENLPTSGRQPLDAITVLAAALVVENRVPEAVKLIGHGGEGNRADYSMLWSVATYGNLFDFQKLSEIPAWLAAPNPQHAAVTWIVASWGGPDLALTWAKTAGSVDAVDASLGVWAAFVGRSTGSTAEGILKIDAGVKDASPTAKVGHGRILRTCGQLAAMPLAPRNSWPGRPAP